MHTGAHAGFTLVRFLQPILFCREERDACATLVTPLQGSHHLFIINPGLVAFGAYTLGFHVSDLLGRSFAQ